MSFYSAFPYLKERSFFPPLYNSLGWIFLIINAQPEHLKQRKLFFYMKQLDFGRIAHTVLTPYKLA